MATRDEVGAMIQDMIQEWTQNWFNVTSSALEQFKQDLLDVYKGGWERPCYGSQFEEEARKTRRVARKKYREFVLGWYRKLCLPLKPGEVTPNEVAVLLVEEQEEQS